MAGWGTGRFAAVKLPRVTPRWRVCDVRLCQTYVQHELASRRPWTEVDSEEPALARPPSQMPHAEVRWGGGPRDLPGLPARLFCKPEIAPGNEAHSGKAIGHPRAAPSLRSPGSPHPAFLEGGVWAASALPRHSRRRFLLGRQRQARPRRAACSSKHLRCPAMTGTGWARGSRVPGRDGTIRGASGHLRPLLPAPCCSHCGTRDQAAAGRCLAVTGGYPDAS